MFPNTIPLDAILGATGKGDLAEWKRASLPRKRIPNKPVLGYV